MSRPASPEVSLKIKQSLAETRERRKSQKPRVFELKVDCHHTPKQTFKDMHEAFYQAKCVINDLLRSDDMFKYDYQHHRTVTKLDKDGNELQQKITLSSTMHRSIIKGKLTDICNLSKAKKKGHRVGRLKFVSRVNCIPIVTGPWLKIQKKGNRITIPGFPKLKVYGLDQLKKLPEWELADAKFIRKLSGFYIHITVMVPKTKEPPIEKGRVVGIDMGIKTAITLSTGEKINSLVPESEFLKFLQRQLHRKQKGSKRYWKLRDQIGREYEHLTNKKNDISNKLVSKLLKENDCVYFQDEQIAGWRRLRAFGPTIQHSILGRVKMKLRNHQEDYDTFMISKWAPTTKYCPKCDHLHTGLTLSDRTFVCPTCGHTEDRDVHAAKNMIEIGRLIKKAEWLEQPSAEKATSGFDFQRVLDFKFKSISAKRRQEGPASLAQD